MKKITLLISTELMSQLGITDSSDDAAIGTAIKTIAAKAAKVDSLTSQLNTATAEKEALETKVTALENAGTTEKVTTILEAALKANTITVALQKQLAKDYATNPTGLKTIIDGLKPYQSVTEQIEKQANSAEGAKAFAGKKWDELMQANLLEDMKANYPDLYKAVYKAEFGSEPA